MRYVCLMGPTAVGKTALAIALHERLPVDLVSVDSAMVYEGLDIGSGKPDRETLRRAPHRLIDVCDPAEAYSAARFATDATQAMVEIDASSRWPLLVGGTGLYFRALTEGLSPLPPADPAVRERLARELVAHGLDGLYERLTEIDPSTAARVHPHDRQRICRALEIWECSGRRWSDMVPPHPGPVPSEHFASPLILVAAPAERSALHRAIAERFEQMLGAGLVDEVAGLRARGDLDLHLPSMRAVGYRQVWEYLEGQYGYAQMVERAVVATRQLARRQLTWLRRVLPPEQWFLVPPPREQHSEDRSVDLREMTDAMQARIEGYFACGTCAEGASPP